MTSPLVEIGSAGRKWIGATGGSLRTRQRHPIHAFTPGLTALALLVTLSACGGPSPRLGDIQDEPILTAPIAATELGRYERESEYGWGLPDSASWIMVAYEVPSNAEEAFKAWVDAYGDAYGLELRESGTVLVGGRGDVNVRINAGDKLIDYDLIEDLIPPSPGATLVTVSVSGTT